MSRSDQTPPVSEGDELDVYVQSIGEKGDGVAKVEGFVVIIPGAKKGESIRIRIKKVLASVAFADQLGEAEKAVSKQGNKPPKPKDEFDDVDLDNLGEASEDFGEELEEQ